MSIRGSIGKRIVKAIGTRTVNDYLEDLMSSGEVQVALDVGCGITSLLTKFRPRVKTVGLDAYTVDAASDIGAHDAYISADLADLVVENIQQKLFQHFGRLEVDLVTMFGLIEHLPKSLGYAILEKAERLTSKYVLADTPNGFVPQGPEFGNPYQRHLSGWYPKDFEGLGYVVRGSCGTRYLRGYMGEPRIKLPGVQLLDSVVLSRVLMTERFPGHAFNICAIKDVRGVRARYKSYDDPARY